MITTIADSLSKLRTRERQLPSGRNDTPKPVVRSDAEAPSPSVAETSDHLAESRERAKVKVSVRNLNFFYGQDQALFDNNLDFVNGKVTAIMGNGVGFWKIIPTRLRSSITSTDFERMFLPASITSPSAR